MTRLLVLILTLALGSSVMARDTNYQYETPLRGETEAERLLNSPRGQELKGVVDLLMKGDKEGAERALEIYRQKYPPGPGVEEQARPQKPYDFGPPLMLPPEAR